MISRFSNEWLYAAGLGCIIVALLFQTVTLVHREHYGFVLIAALALTAFADVCLAVVCWRGGDVWRMLAIITMLPTLFVLFDFLRRANSVF